MNVAPYDAPNFFAPTYFYTAIAHNPTPPFANESPFNAPTYFPPSYFYLGTITSVPLPIPEPVPTPDPVPVPSPTPVPPQVFGRDTASYAAILSLIENTGAFEDVIFGAATQRSTAGADSYPLAVLTPIGWEEADDFDPEMISRRVTFTVTVVVKSEDSSSQFDQLNLLSTIIQSVVDRASLSDTCVPAQTRIRRGQYEFSDHYPEQSVDLHGEFSLLINPVLNNSNNS